MGKRVSLHYNEKVGLPGSCFGETGYWVDGVKGGRGHSARARDSRANWTGCRASGTVFGTDERARCEVSENSQLHSFSAR